MRKIGFVGVLMVAMLLVLGACMQVPPPAPTPAVPPTPPQIILTDSFNLGESITDEKRAQLFPEFSDVPASEAEFPGFPFIMYDIYWGESFFLRQGETVEVLIESDCPVCLSDIEFERGLIVGIGPSVEYSEQWQASKYEEIDWRTFPQKLDLERSGKGWKATLVTNNAPASGYYEVGFVNTSANPVWCEYTVSVR